MRLALALALVVGVLILSSTTRGQIDNSSLLSFNSDSDRNCSQCDAKTAFCFEDKDDTFQCHCKFGYVKTNASNSAIYTCYRPGTATQQSATAAPVTLDSNTKKNMNTAQYISIVIMLGCLAAVFVLMILFYGFKPLRIIQMNQEICLAGVYALIGFLVENTNDKTICMIVAILLHYLFMCAMVFFCLEALHTYSLVTYVVPVKGFLSTVINIVLGYGIPLIPLAFSVGFLYDIYGNNGYHCWCDLEINASSQAWAFLFPICFGAFACAVIAEAQGQGKYEPLPGTGEAEFRSAKVSQCTIMITMPLSLASYIVGLLAVDFQMVALYYVFFVLTVLSGVAIFFAHAAASPKMANMCPCGGKPANSGRVAPSPPSHMKI